MQIELNNEAETRLVKNIKIILSKIIHNVYNMYLFRGSWENISNNGTKAKFLLDLGDGTMIDFYILDLDTATGRFKRYLLPCDTSMRLCEWDDTIQARKGVEKAKLVPSDLKTAIEKGV